MVRKCKSLCSVQQHPAELLEKHYNHHLPQDENTLAVKNSLKTQSEKCLFSFSETTKSPEIIIIL